jgi:hypothetical protein
MKKKYKWSVEKRSNKNKNNDEYMKNSNYIS